MRLRIGMAPHVVAIMIAVVVLVAVIGAVPVIVLVAIEIGIIIVVAMMITIASVINLRSLFGTFDAPDRCFSCSAMFTADGLVALLAI